MAAVSSPPGKCEESVSDKRDKGATLYSLRCDRQNKSVLLLEGFSCVKHL